jgi:uncharacterized membrane protein YkvA (DUF1232 family)
MGESRVEYLDVFPEWLQSLGADAEALARMLTVKELPEPARQALAGGINYLFKSLDLIPDGIDDIGYLDDAFVLRVAAEQAMREDVTCLGPEQLRILNRLAEDAAAIQQFLAADFRRFETYVGGLRKTAARARSVQDILHNSQVQSAFISDLRGFVTAYTPPHFSREEKNLIKLRAFFDAKLPK